LRESVSKRLQECQGDCENNGAHFGKKPLQVNATVPVMSLGVLGGRLEITNNGMLNVGGNFDEQVGANLLIDLGGHVAGAGYGQLNVTGTANLAGNLFVACVNAFLPSLGDSFTLLTFGSRNGSFTGQFLPGLPPGEHWVSTYDPNDFTLSVVPN
jgi:hypothetical protein